MPQNADTGMARPALRVLFINDTSRDGGPGKTLLDIVKFLDPAQIHRSVLLPRAGIVSQKLIRNNAADELIYEPGLIENIFAPVSRPLARADLKASWFLKIPRALGNMALAVRGLARLVRRARLERYDAIFCNGTMANFTGGLLAAFTSTPTVWHVLYTGAGLLSPLHAMLAAGRHVKTIVCVSKPTALQFRHCANKVRLIHDAIDVAEFDGTHAAPILRDELGLSEGSIIFGAHGRILPSKGFAELVKAARIFFDRLNVEARGRCHFVVVGDTPQDRARDTRAECIALAERLGLGGRVHFIGFRTDIPAYVSDFDVAVVPSIYQDPLPLAVLEAMALSRPEIGFDVGGIGEMIEDGVTGRLVPAGDIARLAEACLSYVPDAGLRTRHGAAGRARIEKDFNARLHAGVIAGELARAAGR